MLGGDTKSEYRKAVDTWLAHIKAAGFIYNKHKIIGDDAFQKGKDYIKLLGARNGKIQVFRHGIGRYEITIAKATGKK